MIRFEEHEGNLFRMLEEPVPLTTDAKLPCLCGYIKDKSLAGEYNRRMRNASKIIDRKVIITEIRSSAAYDHELRFGFAKSSCEARYEQLEIIGYPVAEGSHWWALYQMMQGKWVYNPSLEKHKSDKLDTRYLHAYGKFGQDIVVKNTLTGIDSILGAANISHWTNYAEPSGWQLYKEPKSEPEQKPSPSFDVGDWVEYRLDGDTYYGKICDIRGYVYYLSVTTEEIPKDQARAIMLESIIRKLSQSEVIIHIGCLSGTVAEHFPGSDWAFRLIHGNGKESYINFHALDASTRELVKSLLKAMEGE